jgi:hypothetical protein
MKTKRFLAALLAVMMLVSTFAFSASAANTTDTNFEIHMWSPGAKESSTYAARVKQNDTSVYINYDTRVGGSDASGPLQFEAQIWGYYTDSPYYFTDCSSTAYGTPYSRSKAIITLGSFGLMRNDVYERYGYNSCAQIYGAMISDDGIALGCWSPDSVDYGYSYYNYVIYD